VAPPTLGFGLLLACDADAEVLHRHLINLHAVRLFITFALRRAARVDREVRVRANTPRWQLRFVLPPPFFFFLPVCGQEQRRPRSLHACFSESNYKGIGLTSHLGLSSPVDLRMSLLVIAEVPLTRFFCARGLLISPRWRI
jgi:hypothetical protein